MENQVSTRVHWLTFTIFGMSEDGYKAIWSEYFSDKLGELVVMNGGIRRGFQETYQALAGAKLYRKPIQYSEKGDYFCIELPGSACDCLTPEQFRELSELQASCIAGHGMVFRVSRLDLAVDHCPFTPRMVYEHEKAGMVRTWARRSSVRWDESPHQAKKDKSSLGTETFYIGAGESQRMIRIYNERGYTRTELQCRDDWADRIFILLNCNYSSWLSIVLGAIDKYFSVQASWWADFVTMKQEISIVISSARVVSLTKMQKWVIGQVAPTLEVLRRVLGDSDYTDMLRRGVTEDRLQKYGAVLQLGV